MLSVLATTCTQLLFNPENQCTIRVTSYLMTSVPGLQVEASTGTYFLLYLTAPEVL